MDDWPRLAKKMRERSDALGWGVEQLYAATVSDGTVRKMAKGLPVKRPANLNKIARGLGWTPQSIANVLAGGEPTLLTPTSADDPPASLQRQVTLLVIRETTNLAEQVAVQGAEIALLRARLDRLQGEGGRAQP